MAIAFSLIHSGASPAASNNENIALMNFHKLTERLDIIEEARTGQFETLFQTGYLKKAMLDKGIAVPRPLVFEFIVDFLTDKGLVSR
jgi:hypothetical protein